ncbi:ComF family protein [Desulfurispirillum indicum]|uniref:Phosphoribosyltransferase n=1 Tax=Desulfurispirillum indicum (strain ATCC BAA-1389 / DSM 22839 / S5) TaxID=653733 RepID=E6W3S9_DESIS|nr:ComF family protein [Desulfurispirillum indicum]ADU66960.1 phosphoribosyltransferase [Desulfurispirillum indicum S5]UCZ56333.1 ComF family protein [Desulfurispirillum indicum]
MKPLARLCSRVLDIAYPRICRHCHRPIERELQATALCAACSRLCVLDMSTQLLDPLWVTSLYTYKSPLLSLLKSWKYSRDMQALQTLTWYWRKGIVSMPDEYFAGAVVTWVPMHFSKYLYRGFNSARQLALDVPGEKRTLLWRYLPGFSQAGKGRKDRLATAGFAIVPKKYNVQKVVLVDDIVTTGATLRACAVALLPKTGGNVRAVTLLRADSL